MGGKVIALEGKRRPGRKDMPAAGSVELAHEKAIAIMNTTEPERS
jgi:hypothetical protein